MNDIVLRVENLHKRFGSLHVIKGVDLEVQRGERIAIIGASGSGKSTLLRCLNFMEIPTEGQVYLQGKLIGQREASGRIRYAGGELTNLRARVGMVFQQFNLFPHMTAVENVMEGPRSVLRVPKSEARKAAEGLLRRVGLADKLNVYPARLSGGQQQRVAIARALAMKPEILLFDEPTSALDPQLVGEVLHVIRALADEGRTMLLVTHEIGFAYHVADRVLFMHDGVIHESGRPNEILRTPRNQATKAFLERFTEFHF